MVRTFILTAVVSFLLLNETAPAAALSRFDGDTLSAPADTAAREPAAGTATGESAADTAAAGARLLVESAGLRLGRGILREPLGLDADSRGFVYVADAMAGKVYRYSRDGAGIEFDTPPRTASLYPMDVAVFGPYLYVLDYNAGRVLRYDRNGAYLDILLTFRTDEGPRPVSLTAGEGGRIVTTDIKNHSVTVWTSLLDREFTIGGYGWTAGDFNRPVKAAFMPDGRIAVAESGNRRVQLFSAAGTYERTVESVGGIPFKSPRSIAVDRFGNLFVSDTAAGRIVVFTLDGVMLAAVDSFGGDPITPAALAIDWDGYLYVADLRSRSVLLFHLLHLP